MARLKNFLLDHYDLPTRLVICSCGVILIICLGINLANHGWAI